MPKSLTLGEIKWEKGYQNNLKTFHKLRLQKLTISIKNHPHKNPNTLQKNPNTLGANTQL